MNNRYIKEKIDPEPCSILAMLLGASSLTLGLAAKIQVRRRNEQLDRQEVSKLECYAHIAKLEGDIIAIETFTNRFVEFGDFNLSKFGHRNSHNLEARLGIGDYALLMDADQAMVFQQTFRELMERIASLNESIINIPLNEVQISKQTRNRLFEILQVLQITSKSFYQANNIKHAFLIVVETVRYSKLFIQELSNLLGRDTKIDPDEMRQLNQQIHLQDEEDVSDETEYENNNEIIEEDNDLEQEQW